MRKVLIAILATLVAGAAYARPPSTESLKRLFDLMNTDGIANAAIERMKTVQARLRKQQDPDNRMTIEQKRVAALAEEQVIALFQEELSASKMLPHFAQIYSEFFTQEEIDALIAFYRSPEGRSYIAKVPEVTSKYMARIDTVIASLMPKLRKIIGEIDKAKTDYSSEVTLSAAGGEYHICEISISGSSGESGEISASMQLIKLEKHSKWAPLASVILGNSVDELHYRISLAANDPEGTVMKVMQKTNFGNDDFVQESLRTLPPNEAFEFTLSWSDSKWIELYAKDIKREQKISKQSSRIFFLVSGGTAVLKTANKVTLLCAPEDPAKK